MFDPVLNLVHDRAKKQKSIQMWEQIIAGTATNIIGALISSPFELNCTRMQANVPSDPFITDEHQKYVGLTHAIKTITHDEEYLVLCRGLGCSTLRTCDGSGSNLATYSWFRDHLLENGS